MQKQQSAEAMPKRAGVNRRPDRLVLSRNSCNASPRSKGTERRIKTHVCREASRTQSPRGARGNLSACKHGRSESGNAALLCPKSNGAAERSDGGKRVKGKEEEEEVGGGRFE